MPHSPAAGTQLAAHSAATCRWATPTLFLPRPLWLEAGTCPWACVRESTPRVLATTELCATCPNWEPRAATGWAPAQPV